ncbi:hypothetical protein GCK72_018494 [Caenorhabditis remanei]|uniref:7TM GPCR serpentine receptor class x (Srx) domain-containing protein n=1 Tax=Caenorhabditis remanei TaxID=31234 RepID=A0A6A5GA81_CAERE|nr:hypothetical protein GCK72_018494 [Caenorhabditis remanei]KAF1751940.1 hypothetical protein GCK72_018494 [Caenorhabditis remanei]
MLFCSTVGFVTNWMIVVFMCQTTKLKQPFAILTVALAAIDATFSTLYLFYATPMVLFVLFTKYITLCVFIYTCILITLFFGILGCENYYNPEVVAFSYSGQPICKVFALYGDFYEELSLTVIGAVMDLITIWKVLKMRIRTEKGKKDLNFLKQSLSQTTFVLSIVICFTWGPRVMPGKEFAFLFSSILWSAVHCFDGVFTLIFNGEVRKKLKTGSHFRSSGVSGVKSFF